MAEKSPIQFASPDTGVAMTTLAILEVLNAASDELRLGHVDHLRDCFLDVGTLVSECLRYIDLMGK